MHDLLSNKYLDSELLQRNVWYWRRVNAGQLKVDGFVAGDEQYPFDGATIASTDRVFFAMYGRSPQARDWTSSYLLILRNLQQDPGFYRSVLERRLPSELPSLLRVAPGTTGLQRMVGPRVNQSSKAMVMLLMILLFVGSSVSVVLSHQEVKMGSIFFMAIFFLFFGFGATFMNQATVASYSCPECGMEYGLAGVEQCERCHLEFVRPAPPPNLNFTFQMVPRSER